MRYVFLVLFFLSSVGDGLRKAAHINQGVSQARKFYQEQAYEQAVHQYQVLRHNLNVKDDALLLNLAHATYLAGDQQQAQKYYQQLRHNADAALQGAALNQLGLLAFERNNPEKALYFFRQAIINHPLNEIARYNYELVKKYQAANPENLPRRKGPQKKPKSPPPQPQTGQGISPDATGNPDFINDLTNQGQEPATNKPQPGAGTAPTSNNPANAPENQFIGPGTTPQAQGSQAGNTLGRQQNLNSSQGGNAGAGAGNENITSREQQIQTLRQRLGNSDLPPEKALLLLEAMQNAELQYLQQLPPAPLKRKNKNQPDW